MFLMMNISRKGTILEKVKQSEEMAFYFNRHSKHYDNILSVDEAYDGASLVRYKDPEIFVRHRIVRNSFVEFLKAKYIKLKIVAPWECLDDDYNLDYKKFKKIKKHREADYG